MRLPRLTLVLFSSVVLLTPAHAGLFFGKNAKPTPAEQHVPELISVVKTSQDESKRTAAAEELRKFDPVAFPEIVPVLIDVMQHDSKPAVRSEAAQSLGKLRPVSQHVGAALELAITNDTSMRVRFQARSALLSYHLSGYRSTKNVEPPLLKTEEPPLAAPALQAPIPRMVPTPTSSVPLSKGKAIPAARIAPSVPPNQPIPPLIQTAPVRMQPSRNEGPALGNP